MKRFEILLGVAALVVCFGLANSGRALAAINVSYVVTPADLADGSTFSNGQAGAKFGYDAGPSPAVSPPEGSVTQYAPGFASGSFYSNVQGTAVSGGRDYTSFRLAPKAIFGVTDVTIGALSDVTYWTKLESGLDWQVKIYTEKTTNGGSSSTWYDHRFNFAWPTTVGSWNEWSANTLKTNWIKGTGDDFTPRDFEYLHTTYGTEKILFIDIIASYATASPTSYSYLDGVKLTLTNGDTATMNLEAVPEPATIIVWSLLGLAAVGFGAWRRRAA